MVDGAVACSLFDGHSAIRHLATLRAQDGTLWLDHADGEVEALDAAALVPLGDRGGSEAFGHQGREGWRLMVPRPVPPEVAALLPRGARYGGWIDRVGLGPAALGLLAASALVVAALWTSPAWLAPLIPPSWERAYGDALVGDFGGKFCRAREGEAALAALAARVGAGPGHRIRVVDVNMVNAAALPGGNIVIFRKLLDEARSPDEVAGVLAHEIGHVNERHVTEAMVREMGLGLVVAMLGGTTGSNVETALGLSYGRAAEREADGAAIAALSRANISPRGTADFFARLGRIEARMGRVGEALGYISTHPLSAERRVRFERSHRPGHAYRPALSPEQWRALRGICAA